jgi:hypothetical protein
LHSARIHPAKEDAGRTLIIFSSSSNLSRLFRVYNKHEGKKHMKTIKSAIWTQYNKALKSGAFDRLRVNRALGILQHGEPRPYNTTISTCDCPDSAHGHVCKHRIAKMLAYRAFEAILAETDSVTIGSKVFVDGAIFPIDAKTGHLLAQNAGFAARTVPGGIAYRKGK